MKRTVIRHIDEVCRMLDAPRPPGTLRHRIRVPAWLGSGLRQRLVVGCLVAVLVLGSHVSPVSAVCGDSILDPGEQCEVGPNGDAACQEACIPMGQPGGCTCARPATDPASYALIAEDVVKLCAASEVITGNVGVLHAGGVLTVGKGGQGATGNQLTADQVQVRDGASVGRIFANVGTFKSGILFEGGPYRFSAPLALAPVLPALDAAMPGTNPFSVEPPLPGILIPGAYGTVFVGRGATLILRGTDPGRGVGTYDLASLILHAESHVVAENAVNVRIASLLAVPSRASIGPASGDSLLAGDVRLSVTGLLVRIGHLASLRAHLRAAGAVRVGRGASVVGRIVANSIKLGGEARIRAEGGCGDGMLEGAEQCDATAPGGTAACPTTCALPGQPGQCACP